MVWHPEDVQNLIYLLIDEYNARTFVDGKPKDPKLWQQIAQKLDIPDYPGISGVQVMEKVNSLKQDYKAFQFLKDQTGVGWDEEKDTVDADDGWWDLKSQVYTHNMPIASLRYMFHNKSNGYLFQYLNCL